MISKIRGTHGTPLRRGEGGGVMIFIALVITVLIGLVGFAVDTVMLMLTVEIAQSAADSASLAGANTFRESDQLVRWQNSKRAVLGAISAASLRGLDAPALASLASDAPPKSFRYTLLSANNTPSDVVPYDRHSGQSGNLLVTTARGLFCYDPDPNPSSPTGFIRRWYSLEGRSTNPGFCIANSVKVSIEIQNIQTWIIRVLGATNISRVRVESTSYLKAPNGCGNPLCSTLGSTLPSFDQFGQHFEPLNTCP